MHSLESSIQKHGADKCIRLVKGDLILISRTLRDAGAHVGISFAICTGTGLTMIHG